VRALQMRMFKLFIAKTYHFLKIMVCPQGLDGVEDAAARRSLVSFAVSKFSNLL